MINCPSTWLLPQDIGDDSLQAIAPSNFAALVSTTVTLVVVFGAPVNGDQVVSIVSDDATIADPQTSSVTVLDGQQTADVLIDLLRVGSANITATHGVDVKNSIISVAARSYGPSSCEDGPDGESAFELVPVGLSAERTD